MKALILAAGYATRMYPLTKDFPKPLLSIGRHSIIDFTIAKLEAAQEVDEIIIVTNSKFISRFREWLKSVKSSKRLSLLDDLTKRKEDRRGAIGDMYFAVKKRRIQDNLLVVGGDNLFDSSLRDFLSFVKKFPDFPIVGAFDIQEKKAASQYGVLSLDKKNRIVDFVEKPKKPNSTVVAMCLYYFPKSKLRLLDEYMCLKDQSHDASGCYIGWLSKRVTTKAFVFRGCWYDIGNPQFYKQAKKEFGRVCLW